MAGLFGMLTFFGMDAINAGLGLLILNLVAWTASELTNYKDGKLVFQIGFYLAIAFILISSLALGGRVALGNAFAMLRVMHL